MPSQPSGDTLLGGPGNDTLLGGAADDLLEDLLGDDLLEGGPGLNTINPVTPRKARDAALIAWATAPRNHNLPLRPAAKTWVTDFVTALAGPADPLGVNRDILIALPGARR